MGGAFFVRVEGAVREIALRVRRSDFDMGCRPIATCGFAERVSLAVGDAPKKSPFCFGWPYTQRDFLHRRADFLQKSLLESARFYRWLRPSV